MRNSNKVQIFEIIINYYSDSCKDNRAINKERKNKGKTFELTIHYIHYKEVVNNCNHSELLIQ